MLAKARAAHADRLRDRDPGEWGISAEILHLPTSGDVSAGMANRRQVAWARRSNAFDLLHQAKKYDSDGRLVAGISDLQLKAAERYVGDWMQRMGVGWACEIRERVDEGGGDKGRTDLMVEAGQRLDEAHRALGRMSVVVLRALVEPMMAGEVRLWRELVRAATGEADRTAQATVVRTACEDLRLAYDEIDGVATKADVEAPRIPIRLWQAE